VSAVLNKDPTQRKMARMDELDDMVTTTSATFLGLTVNCARCHDHKFDPIPTRDYYRMTAAFSGAGFGERSVASAEERAKYDAQVKPLRAELSRIEGELSAMEEGVSARLLTEKYRRFDEGRKNEARRIPINPLYNREAFPPVKARWFRLAIFAHDSAHPRIDRLELRPAGHVTRQWSTKESAQADKPVYLTVDLEEPKNVSEVFWSSNEATGSRSGMMTIYRLEASEDGKTWRTLAANTDHVSKLEADLPDLPDEELTAALSPTDREKRGPLRRRQEELQKQLGSIPSPAKIYAATTHQPEPAYLLERGSVQKQKEEVVPGGLSAVTQIPAAFELPKEADDGQRRLALARWITDPRNPLTARVIVNRVWYYHFGAGLVNTPSDFGANGDHPSHPELLDWLAASFMEHGWSLKWLNTQASTVDAGNRLLWRYPLRRMDAETLRDSLLWLSGSLDMRMGGPSFPLHQKGGRGSFIYHTVDNDGPAVWRRCIYRFVVRGGDKTLLDSFDCPDPSVATPQRQASNTPTQALALLNNAFVIRQAGLFAKRLEKEAATPEERVRRAYLLAVGREATAKEIAAGSAFVRKVSLTAFCRALVNGNEFVYTP
jgi:hypothetical protein